MKKITLQLVVASIFLVGSLANASENPVFSDTKTNRNFNRDEPIAFLERGISFYVFQNGEFDFNTRPDDSQGDYYYKSAGRRFENTDNRRPQNIGVRIEYDSFGRVRRVGNTFINYDFNNRVSRIGSVFMRYNRFALTQVGGLQIIYNRRGEIVDIFGSVKRNFYNNCNNGYQYNGYSNQYQNNSEYQNDSENSDNADINNFYYYKSDGTKAVIEKTDDAAIKNEQKAERRENRRD